MKSILMRIRLIWLGLIVGAIAPSGCCYFSHTCKEPNPVLQQGIDCGVAAVETAAVELLPQVIAILSGTSLDTVKADLASLLISDGKQAVACALDKAIQDLGGVPPASQPTSMTVASYTPALLQRKVLYATMAARAAAFLATNDLKIKRHAK